MKKEKLLNLIALGVFLMMIQGCDTEFGELKSYNVQNIPYESNCNKLLDNTKTSKWYRQCLETAKLDSSTVFETTSIFYDVGRTDVK